MNATGIIVNGVYSRRSKKKKKEEKVNDSREERIIGLLDVWLDFRPKWRGEVSLGQVEPLLPMLNRCRSSSFATVLYHKL